MNRILKRKFILKMIATGLLCTIAGCAPENLSDTLAYDQNGKPAVQSNVIYGIDGRLDIYQVSDDRLKLLADSTVALIDNASLTVGASSVVIKGSTFQSAYNLCPSEKFKEQSTPAFCSGSLVGEDTIITAGHCIKSAADCSKTSFVFGFAVKNSGVLPTSVAPSEVYKCASIVKQVLDSGIGKDYAVIKLNRKVTGHAILKVRSSGEPSVGDSLVVIGHPTGLPTKITTGGKIRSVANADYLIASVDTYGGNSGSAVFNESTGLIEGILVRGEQDFVQQGSCTVSKVCAEGACRGEDITRISVVRPFIPNLAPPPPTPEPELNSDLFSVVNNLAIPDYSTIGIQSVLPVNKTPMNKKVYVTLNISHTYIGDLVIKLISPSGKEITLHSRAGGSADDIKKVIEVTSSLGSESARGNYRLHIQDLAKIDIGQLNSWSLEFKP
jgi:Proprotein convertase P-domain/Trypsin-like peptidase domain